MIELDALEARIIGALIEKEITTPDQYPLSLKALAVACNQKTNREPVMELQESEVQETLDRLSKRNLAAPVVFGGRVPKFKHRFCNTQFSQLHLNPRELALICVLLLRGAQTPGELRSRAQRMAEFSDVDEVEVTLSRLLNREEGSLVKKLAMEPGRREARFVHQFFSGEDAENLEKATSSSGTGTSKSGDRDRINRLERELAQLREEFDRLKAEWQDFNG